MDNYSSGNNYQNVENINISKQQEGIIILGQNSLMYNYCLLYPGYARYNSKLPLRPFNLLKIL